MVEYCPKVSIGLPVYNGEKYLREAIESILAQTFTDFELIISDNASTDNTEMICREYESKDSRVRYYRNEKNIGGSNNHNRVFELSRGKYFHWFSDDDLYAPEFLEKSVKVLDENSSISLCFSTFKVIDENGEEVSINSQMLGQSAKPHERLRELASWHHDCEANYGLTRTDILRRTDLERNYSDSDRTLLCEIGLYGKFYIFPEPLFSRREHPGRSARETPGFLEKMAWYYPELKGKEKSHSFFIHWKQFLHYLTIISRSPLTLEEKLGCYFYMGQWVLMHKRWEIMIRELLSPLRKAYSRFVKGLKPTHLNPG